MANNNQSSIKVNTKPTTNNSNDLELDAKITKPQLIEINHGDQLNASNSIQVLLVTSSASDSILGLSHTPQPDQTIRIHFYKTRVQDLKAYMFQNWQGKPKTDGIRLIARGRILNDSEVIGAALGKLPDASSAHAIHVVVRPNAWTEKLPFTPSRSVSAPPIATAAPSVSASNSTLTSAQPLLPNLGSSIQPPSTSMNLNNPLNENLTSLPSDPTSTSTHNGLDNSASSSAQLFVNHFSSLTGYGKANFIQNILQARFKIVERVDYLRRQIHDNHLLALGMTSAIKKTTLNSEQIAQHEQEWKAVEEKIIKLLTDLNAWNYYPEPTESVDFDSNIKLDSLAQSVSEFKRVEIGGLPYLLYIPESSTQPTSQHEPIASTPASHLKTYMTLQRELNRALYVEAQVDLLILQAQKIQAGLNQLDYIISASGINQTSNYAQRFQNMIHNLGAPPPPAGLPPFPPAPANAPAPGFGFGFGIAPDGLLPPNHFLVPNGQMWQHPVARVRRYEFTINLDSIRRYLGPLLWLSLKLSVLLYIFGRHASASKLAILIMIALGWVLWEAFSISQRHEAQARRRERLQRGQQAPGAGAAGGPAVDPIQAVLDRGRRRAERERLQQLLREQRQRVDGLLGVENPEPVVPLNNPQPAAPAPAQPVEPPVAAAAAANPVPRRNGGGGLRAAAAHIRARGGAFPPGTEVRPFRSTSALSPKYWFNSIAVVGLASEYRELGLHSIGERAMGASNLEYPKWYRYLRNTKTCLILFFGTLLPEIEKKRRKALEKRARILNLVIADAARDSNNQPRNQDQQRVTAQAGDNTNDGSINSQAVTNTQETPVPRSSSDECLSSRAIHSGEDKDNQLTPRATKATALEKIPSGSSNERLSSRRSKLVPELNEANNLVFRASTEQPKELKTMNESKVESVEEKPQSSSTGFHLETGQVENKSSIETIGNASVPSTSSIPNPESSSGQHQEPQEAIVNDNSTVLPSPLTPMDPPQVVGGLDDTDDEEIIGNENEEPGMLLF